MSIAFTGSQDEISKKNTFLNVLLDNELGV